MLRKKVYTAIELYEYIEDKKLEYEAILMLLFNNLNFFFLPLYKPSIEQVMHNGLPHFAFGANNYNILQSEYQYNTFMLDITKMNGGNRFLYHPENLYGYMSLYQSNITVEYYFERGSKGAEIIRKAAVINFLESVEIDTVDQLLECMECAKRIMKNKFGTVQRFFAPRLGHQEVLFDQKLIDSFRMSNNKSDIEHTKILFRKSIAFAERHIYESMCITYKTTIVFPGYDTEKNSGKINGIILHTTNVPKCDIKTPLDREVAIVNKEDRISDILYNIALKIKATDYMIAVGYAYESGLELLAPALMSVRYNADLTDERDERKAELVVGSLQSYDGQVKIKQMSRASAQRINDLTKSICVKNLYTCSEKFYHGKFYYICSDKEAYVITGSSNITKPAYEKNYEFDLIFHFVRDKNNKSALETELLNWFTELLSNCIELKSLDESLFPSSTVQDENGSNPKTSFYRSLESEEERERYILLEKYNPSRISEYAFKARPYKAFKKYILFEYASRGISVLEGFSYGNSCYVLNIVKEDNIKEIIAWKSKEQVRESDSFITNIPHDSEYNEMIGKIFHKYPEIL